MVASARCPTRTATTRVDAEGASRRAPAGCTCSSGILGISDATARALLERFGSVERLLAAGPDEWAEVSGVGPVRAHALAEALLGHGNGAAKAA
jgi:excinuclease ABC subunit C